jgi:hypothetical protein
VVSRAATAFYSIVQLKSQQYPPGHGVDTVEDPLRYKPVHSITTPPLQAGVMDVIENDGQAMR